MRGAGRPRYENVWGCGVLAGTDMNAFPSHRAIYVSQQETDVVRDLGLGVEVCEVYEMILIRLAAANARVRVQYPVAPGLLSTR